jgi:hypothetical protein
MGLAIQMFIKTLAQETAVNLYAPIGTGDYRENGNRGMGALQVKAKRLSRWVFTPGLKPISFQTE